MSGMPIPPTPPQPPHPEPPPPPPPPLPPPPIEVDWTMTNADEEVDAASSAAPDKTEPSTGVTESNTETEIRTLQPRPGDIVAGRGPVDDAA